MVLADLSSCSFLSCIYLGLYLYNVILRLRVNLFKASWLIKYKIMHSQAIAIGYFACSRRYLDQLRSLRYNSPSFGYTINRLLYNK